MTVRQSARIAELDDFCKLHTCVKREFDLRPECPAANLDECRPGELCVVSLAIKALERGLDE